LLSTTCIYALSFECPGGASGHKKDEVMIFAAADAGSSAHFEVAAIVVRKTDGTLAFS
jgi:hypothetical protein